MPVISPLIGHSSPIGDALTTVLLHLFSESYTLKHMELFKMSFVSFAYLTVFER